MEVRVTDDIEAMRIAIAISEGVRGTTSPNPPVGAVIVAGDGRIVGHGATEPTGGRHAEVIAIDRAGDQAAGATAYVTLEPCAHHGRTPPCAQALVDAGVDAVRYGVVDPNPEASGGADLLTSAGIDVQAGPVGDEVAQGPLRAWLHWVRTGRPHVTWKYAATLDGRVAAADGTSRWISSAEARAEVHRMRAKADAIVVGTATVRGDDPSLTARNADGSAMHRQPLRVVVGTSDIPPDARVLDDTAATIRVRSQDPDEVLAVLGDNGVVDVLLEGGPRLAGAFAKAGRIDRMIAYVAPAVLGAGPSALEDAGVATITEMRRWTVEAVTMAGCDVRVSAVPQPSEDDEQCSPA